MTKLILVTLAILSVGCSTEHQRNCRRLAEIECEMMENPRELCVELRTLLCETDSQVWFDEDSPAAGAK